MKLGYKTKYPTQMGNVLLTPSIFKIHREQRKTCKTETFGQEEKKCLNCVPRFSIQSQIGTVENHSSALGTVALVPMLVE